MEMNIHAVSKKKFFGHFCNIFSLLLAFSRDIQMGHFFLKLKNGHCNRLGCKRGGNGSRSNKISLCLAEKGSWIFADLGYFVTSSLGTND